MIFRLQPVAELANTEESIIRLGRGWAVVLYRGEPVARLRGEVEFRDAEVALSELLSINARCDSASRVLNAAWCDIVLGCRTRTLNLHTKKASLRLDVESVTELLRWIRLCLGDRHAYGSTEYPFAVTIFHGEIVITFADRVNRDLVRLHPRDARGLATHLLQAAAVPARSAVTSWCRFGDVKFVIMPAGADEYALRRYRSSKQLGSVILNRTTLVSLAAELSAHGDATTP